MPEATMPDQLQIITTLRTPNAHGNLWDLWSLTDLANAYGLEGSWREQLELQVATMVEEGLLAHCTCGCRAVKITELGGALLAVCDDA